MIITKEIAGGFVSLAAIISYLFKKHFILDPELLTVKSLVSQVHASLKTFKHWIENEADIKEEEFIKYVNAFSESVGMLLLEISYMQEEKKFLSLFGENKDLARSSFRMPTFGVPFSEEEEEPVRWRLPFFKEEEEPVRWGTPDRKLRETVSMKAPFESVLSDFSNYETQLEVIRRSVPDIESSIFFPYKDEMRIKKLSDFGVANFNQLAALDPVEFSNRESIPRSLAENLVSYAGTITARSEFGTHRGMSIGSLTD